jgi:hypothetical protein
MFRRSLFLGLTVMLAAVLVSLVIKGRQQEKKVAADAAASRVTEVVKQYKPTPTRVIAPHDLVVVVETSQPPVVRNIGKIPYTNPELEITFSRGKKETSTEKLRIEKTIQPGEAIPIGVPDLPDGTKASRIRVRSAEVNK